MSGPLPALTPAEIQAGMPLASLLRMLHTMALAARCFKAGVYRAKAEANVRAMEQIVRAAGGTEDTINTIYKAVPVDMRGHRRRERVNGRVVWHVWGAP